MTAGMLLGKFLPPHLGHRYLVDFARHYVDDLTVLVCSIESEPIDGTLRHEWMTEMFPSVDVLHVDDPLPQEPSDHPDFWRLWRDAIRRRIPSGTDFVFASEDYGFRLAEELGAEYVPVDHARELMPVSGTDVRNDPMGYWRYLPACVRPYFLRRVCVFGPESTGKTTLSRQLAGRFDTRWVAEYARRFIDAQRDEFSYEDIVRVARGHRASEEALARQANRVLFVDTDLITTMIWSDVFFGRCPDEVVDLAREQRYDLYLVCDVDVPFAPGPQRHFPDPDDRREFFDRCVDELERRDRPYMVVSGDPEERLERASEAVEALLL